MYLFIYLFIWWEENWFPVLVFVFLDVFSFFSLFAKKKQQRQQKTKQAKLDLFFKYIFFKIWSLIFLKWT